MKPAEQLNEKWEALSERFDLLKSVPKTEGALVNKAISDWQDFYWSHFDAWGNLITWQDRYLKTARLVDALAKKTVTVASVSQTDGYQPPKPAKWLPPLVITAPRPPTPTYRAPAPVLYSESPAPPPRESTRFASVGSVDVSGWGGPVARSSEIDFSLPEPTAAWEARLGPTKLNRTGLLAAIVSVGTAIWGKKEGWL